MPYFLRYVQGEKWFRLKESRNWVNSNCPAELLSDLEVREHNLSFFELADDTSDLRRAVASEAASRKSLSDVAAILIDQEKFDLLGLQIFLDQ